MPLFGPAQSMSPQERAEAIRAGVMTAEDFLPATNKPAVPAGYDNRPSSAQEDLAKSLGIPVSVLIQRQNADKCRLRPSLPECRPRKAGGGLIEGGLGRLAKLLNGAGPTSKGVMDVVRDVPIHAGGPAVTARSFEPEDFGELLDQLRQFGKAKALPPDHSTIFSEMVKNAGEDGSRAVTHVTLDADGVPHAAAQVSPQSDADYLAYLVSLNGGKGAGTQALDHIKDIGTRDISSYPSHSALGFWDKQMNRDPRWDVVPGEGDNVSSLRWKRQNKAKGGVISQDEARRNLKQGALGSLKRFFSALPEAASHWPKEAWDMVRMPADLVMGGSPEQKKFDRDQASLGADRESIRPMLDTVGADRFRAGSPEAAANNVTSFVNPVANAVFSPVKHASALGTLSAEAVARAMNSEGALASMLTAGMRPMGAVKSKGGQWLAGSVEDALRGELRNTRDPNIRTALEALNTPPEIMDASASLDDWIKGPLTNYIKRDMGTPNDPIVKLADQGIQLGEAAYTSNPGGPLMVRRTKAGLNPSGEATTDAGKAWENTLDHLINTGTAGDLSRSAYKPMLEQNSWLSKVDPATPVHSVNKDNLVYEGGISHMLDEMYNALGSDLPEHLRIDPKALASGNFSVDAAVRRVHDINKWRADATTAANQARASNAATVLHKEYPDKGFKWVELKAGSSLPEGAIMENIAGGYRVHVPGAENQSAIYTTPELALANHHMPALADALKYEGDTMGHCVGGYCDDVASGRSRIYSLRDAKGQPHVTIEARPDKYVGFWDLTDDVADEYYARAAAAVKQQRGLRKIPGDVKTNDKHDELHDTIMQLADEMYTDDSAGKTGVAISQIKGKGNAKPHDDYIPYIQDFVKNGQWSDVLDHPNASLNKVAAGDGTFKYLTDDEVVAAGKQAQVAPPSDDYFDQNLPPDDFAEGGLVNNDVLALYGYN